ncbi:cation diffusion facilitator family transporter [Veillonella caviae]|uniref:cation diffusion facilitator family transporter n=1 Tax=Veillonella caviae TaxID=248316 RepID=UPI002A90D706|nr:cation diffusion facilitator family transporter [Veillonella caviae]MDY5409694.1 cation diffusion facilitator family transporter [Veillonella caviae]
MILEEHSAERNRGITMTSIKGIIGNVLLVAFKMFVGLASNSIAIILDAVNNLTDVLSSVLTIIGTKLASKSADKEHPFGHGRIEYMTTMAIAFIILGAGIMSLKESVEKIIHPEPSVFDIPGLIIITVAIVVKVVMGRYVKAQGEKYKSDALVASGIDALFDAVITFATLISAGLVYFFDFDIQGYVGAIISLFILKAAFDILREMYNHLIGIRADDNLVREIKETIAQHPQVGGVYDLVLNSYGSGETIGAVHISLPENLTIGEIHPLTKGIAVHMYKKFGIAMTVGVYAENEPNLEVSAIRQALDQVISLYTHVVQIHAFYVRLDKKIIYYDIIFDFDEEDPYGTLEKIKAEMKIRYPDYAQFAIVDTDFSN